MIRLIVLVSVLLPHVLVSVSTAGRSFRINYDTNSFERDGKPFRYVSGAMHYFRTPSDYWSDRLKSLRASGANAVETYIEWSLHEPEPGVYEFEGEKDLVKYLKLAQEADLLVVLRPGPFIDAERDFVSLKKVKSCVCQY